MDRESENGTAASRTAWFAEQFDALAQNVESFIRGKPDTVRMVLICILAEGHLLLEDVPGTGKTSLAKAISQSIDGSMRRIQFTPDLLPSDVTGVQVYDTGKREFVFHPGAVFANIVLGDEINRASPKTQSALLEVMAERQVTIDSVPYLVPRPFTVIATQNPVEQGGTYDLPEAELDRFMMRTTIGYPNHEAEVQIVSDIAAGRTTDTLQPVMTTTDLQQMNHIAAQVYLAPALLDYAVTITASTRNLPDLRLGISPRGTIAIAKTAQAFAATQGRTFVTADDVKAVVPYVLPHRMILRPEAEIMGRNPHEMLQQILTSVPVPQHRAGV